MVKKQIEKEKKEKKSDGREREREAEEVFLSWIMDGPNQTKPNQTLSVTFSLVGEEIKRNCSLLCFP